MSKNSNGLMSPAQIKAFLAAHESRRVGWIVTGPRGEPVNGGSGPSLPMPVNGAVGKWQPRIEGATICESGYHMTDAPHKWKGCRVFLGWGRGARGRQGDKTCWVQRRAIAEVDPEACVDASVWARAMSISLVGASLVGASLDGASLVGASLDRASLDGASLVGAYLGDGLIGPDGEKYANARDLAKFGAIVE